ncbi:polysaccharide biosynthesis/export family protein [Marivirga sp. S37H4]|uniref:Polysaccharide biosynthesis/export family protein n=1 Tax=Marivirga aurantiaca TaxID=2802615 RepID=A0A934WZR4_9BACT|nr:polysaccharide biosynthesis/export family protein [Marivirga aurantiaca]
MLLTAFWLSGCKVYKQNIILQTEDDIKSEHFKSEIAKVEGAYTIKAGDKLSIEVYTNKGERVLDPNLELGSLGGGSGGQAQMRPKKEFEVLPTGEINLPLIGLLNVEGYSIKSLQEHLTPLYGETYIDPYIRIEVLNRRVVVLGAMGGQVIPLENEKMNLLEVLALSGGLTKDSKGNNIRLIRGPLDNPSVQVINLSTIEGMQQAGLDVLPNDIIYVEPLRRVLTESIREIAPVIGIVTNVITLFIVIQSLNSNNRNNP